jgi:hypothetical protein
MATNLELASNIATVVNLFKFEFPDAKSDLKPWQNDPQTRELVDPDSIDIGFHFPGISSSWRSRSVLIQIRFYEDPITASRRAIGIETAGFDHQGEAWRLSTVENWNFVGRVEPKSEIREKLKKICQQIIELFNKEATI